MAEKVTAPQGTLCDEGFVCDVLAGGSYTFDLWSADLVRYVSPGSWTYSSALFDIKLVHLGWHPAAFVPATVI